jgi:hypothetical protein
MSNGNGGHAARAEGPHVGEGSSCHRWDKLISSCAGRFPRATIQCRVGPSTVVRGVEPNLVAVQWGLIGVFGIVVGLLIAPADRFLQEFLASAKAVDQKRAAQWALSLKVTALIVCVALGCLSVLGASDAGLGFKGRLVTNSWLLLMPLFAQIGLVALVFCLVKKVPPLEKLRLQQPPDFRASPGGIREPTLVRFVNKTSVEMQVIWIDFDGHEQRQDGGGNPFTRLSPSSEALQSTYEGHRFLVSTATGTKICTVEAEANPGTAVIEDKHLSRLKQFPPGAGC